MFGSLAPRLRDVGWQGLIPIRKGVKAPVIPRWQKFSRKPQTDADVERFCTAYGGCGVGHAFGADAAVGIDLDHLDPAIAFPIREIADEHLGDTPLVRIGNAPKSFRFYRASDPIPSRKPQRLQVEIFGRSGQCVLFGNHPDGFEYVWPEESPLDVGPDDLPVITKHALRSFLSAVAEFRGVDTSNPSHGAPEAGLSDFDPNLDTSGVAMPVYRLLVANPEADERRIACEYVEAAEAGGRHHSAMGAAVALADRGYSDDEIFSILIGPFTRALGRDRDGEVELSRIVRWARQRVGPDFNQLVKILGADQWGFH